MSAPVRIGITMGDPNGVGPEVVAKALRLVDEPGIEWIVYGRASAFESVIEGGERSGAAGLGDVELAGALAGVSMLKSGSTLAEFRETGPVGGSPVSLPGVVDASAGSASMDCLEQAVSDCLEGVIAGIVTAPISKEAIALAGWPFPGHTEYLAMRAGGVPVLMTMMHGGLRVALQTGHVPFEQVAERIDPESLRTSLHLLSRSLMSLFGTRTPRVAVLGLNPHAGDGGVLGRQEREILEPVIREFEKVDRGVKDGSDVVEPRDRMTVDGPFPADAFFARQRWRGYDAVLAMYHDQGLIPFKMLDEGRGVNVTLGLPFVRTSPDHGTAFDIAGKGLASPDSMAAAMRLAGQMCRRKMAGGGR